jgi:hypothetical protein
MLLRQILPRLTVRHVTRDIACSPGQPMGSRYLVRGEVLKPLARAAAPVS